MTSFAAGLQSLTTFRKAGIGLLTSLGDAIITKSYVPIIVTGLLFGACAGVITGRWGAKP